MPTLPPVKQFPSDTGARVYRISCDVLPLLSGRVYLILGTDTPTLVDTGSGSGICTSQIFQGLEEVRTRFGEAFSWRDLGRVVLTHAHIDHFGGLPEIVRRTGAEVAVHALDRRAVEAYDERAARSNFAFDRFLRQAGVPGDRRREVLAEFGYVKGRIESVAVNRELADGENAGPFRVIHTPGHSPGHVCLAVGDILLAGDHILAKTVSQLWPESVAACTGLGHYLDSLEKIERCGPFRLVMGGHEPVIHDLAQRLEEIRAAHQRRLERLIEILSGAPEPLCVDQLSERMYSRQRGYPALLALTDVGARVEHLEQLGRITIADIDQLSEQPCPVFRYRPA
ncbi:MAG: MBL fold metallo-hydrolase [Thermoguttaceae bacterium]|jgi:glyoxylase-like metal-dependent hydrolase (beta-lactamase superfamily II)